MPPSKGLNLPNCLTIARIILAVFFLLQVSRIGLEPKILALSLFLVASLTDYLDGWIARTRNQITPFGRLMDPIADKVLTLSAFISFVQMDLVQGWMVLVIIGRDLMITGTRLLMRSESENTGARKSGKHKTALQFLAIVGILIFLIARETSIWNAEWNSMALQIIHGVMLFVVAVTLWSGIRYLYANRETLKNQSF